MTTKLTLEGSAARARAPFDRVPSPCTLDCRSFPWRGKTYCRGCLRTTDEVREWQTMDEEKRREVWAQLADRAEKLRG